MTKVVSSTSNGKRFLLQMSLEIKGISKKKYIRLRHLEKGEEELQRNLDTDFFFPGLSLLVIHCCQLVKHQAVSNIISHYSSINVVVICTICHTNIIGQRKHFLRAMLK